LYDKRIRLFIISNTLYFWW